MNLHRRSFLAFGLGLLCSPYVAAQEPSTNASAPVTYQAWTIADRTPLPRVVAGQPYSAVTETEISQTTGDGTLFERHMARTKTYRDSQGRTRREHYIPAGLASSDQPELASVMIHDPVAGVAYFLDPRKHTARRMPFRIPIVAENADNGGIITHIAPPRTSPNPERPRPKITEEDLGTQVIDGFVVEGKRTTMTFPTDAEGNDRPFDRVTERWLSNELKIYILIKNTDPRTGQNTIKTTVTDRSEPDPSLFQVPADYTITQQ